jgi:hypothetical protein
MPTFSLRNRTARTALAVLAAAGLGAGAMVTAGPAHADPKQLTNPLVAVGSDTVQDIDNALGGMTNDIDYTPVHSTVANGRQVITSWDAIGSSCISPKAPGASFVRPNGSGAGRRALSRAIDGGNWGVAGDACGGPKPVSGLIDYARSSSVSSSSGTALTYIPFGRDGVSYAFYTVGGATPVSLTRADLTSIYTTGTGSGTTIGGTLVIPCGIQTSSGTFAFWNTVTTATTTQENNATQTCNAAGTGSRIEENSGAALKAKGDAMGTTAMYIVGHSAASWIAQQNGRAPSALGAGVGIGSITDDGTGTNLGAPVSGSAPNMTPNATFYNSTVFGRYVYHVFDTNRVTGLGNAGLKSLFVGSGSILCQTGAGSAQATVNAFGFLTPSNCGDTSTQRGLDSGSS